MAAVPAGRKQGGRDRVPSLRRRLLVRLLVPLGALAVGLGVGGAALIDGFVQSTHDRLLAGSTLAIAERLAVDDDNGEVTVDLPAVAFGMLESQARDNIYYNVAHEGGVITGYLDLPLPDISAMPTNVTLFRDATYHGHPVRVAAQARRLYGVAQPVLVQVAETTEGRRAQVVHLFLWLALLEVALVGGSGVLVWGAVGRGLAPLGRLRRVIDSRSARGMTGGAPALVPLPLAVVPVEVLPLVIAINGLLARLDQSIGTMRRFTADASHQLRTPLAVLRTHLALLRRYGTDSAEGRAALDDVEGAVKRLERLLVQLLALARADEDPPAMPSTAEVTDLPQVAMEVAAEQVPAALAQDVEVRFEGGFEGGRDGAIGPRVAGNPVLVGELLGNLLDNAIRYNRPGGMVTVRVGTGTGAGPVMEVEDDGPGIPEAERERVFERFYRLDRPGEPPRTGSGLGLAIVRALADRLGASVRLDAGPDGRGLKVTVTLRPAEAAAASVGSAAESRGV
ncbi:two-component sensor histidine kinase (plasmid) [Azospirillum sp. B510]|uniref:sensor histidine kinase n=2 Tax=Alphaproteobacteria TaxID=28211 RepID=UPI0001C4BAC4|nr:sensor histidine kinase [Azospirillum sp. B510]BAI73837.1 two-component sensor histidine kinase [Azospirillum sp. B510]